MTDLVFIKNTSIICVLNEIRRSFHGVTFRVQGKRGSAFFAVVVGCVLPTTGLTSWGGSVLKKKYCAEMTFVTREV